jgi:hypothetical protein
VLLLLNQTVISGEVQVVCVALISTSRGVFIGVQGGVTDFVNLVEFQFSHYSQLLAGHPLGPLVSGLCTLPPRVRYTPGVTLILVEFQFSL